MFIDTKKHINQLLTDYLICIQENHSIYCTSMIIISFSHSLPSLIHSKEQKDQVLLLKSLFDHFNIFRMIFDCF